MSEPEPRPAPSPTCRRPGPVASATPPPGYPPSRIPDRRTTHIHTWCNRRGTRTRSCHWSSRLRCSPPLGIYFGIKAKEQIAQTGERGIELANDRSDRRLDSLPACMAAFLVVWCAFFFTFLGSAAAQLPTMALDAA